MEQQGSSVRKAYKYKLKPSPQQEWELERVLVLCRHLYNAAVGERREAWRMRGVSISYYQQKAELPGIKEAMPEYAVVNAQVLQDVVLRVDRAFQAFFRRIREGQTPGYPRFHGRDRYNSFTYPQVGDHGGARLDNGFLVLSKIGRIAVRWSRPIEGAPRTATISREADGWYVCFSCANVSIQPLPQTGQETGIDLGLEAFATLSSGERIFHPGWYRKAERALKTAQRRVESPQEWEPSQTQGGAVARQGASEGEAPADRFPPQDGAGAGQNKRYDLSRELADPQYGEEPPLGQEHQRCGLGGVPEHPELQGSMRRSLSDCGQSCVHEPDVFWLRYYDRQGLVRPLACLPGV